MGPVGAGPFIVDSYAKEALILKRNPNYWNGPPYLDSVKFVNFVGAFLELLGGQMHVA